MKSNESQRGQDLEEKQANMWSQWPFSQNFKKFS